MADLKVRIAKRCAKEFKDGEFANLGIGLPTMVADYIPEDVTVTFHSENGFAGIDAVADASNLDVDIINSGGTYVTAVPRVKFFDTAESFGLVRGGHVKATVLGAMEVAENGEDILFVGTKKQAQESIKEEAERVGMYYVNARWLGGMLTNFKTIQKRIARLNQLNKMEEDGTFELLPKKEVVKLKLETEKLEKYLGGIKDMKKLPGAMFVVDPRKEKIAVSEAKKLGIPVVAIVDTNCDPDDVDYVIPGNDDAIRAVKLIASTMANAVVEGRQGEDAPEAVQDAESEESAEA